MLSQDTCLWAYYYDLQLKCSHKTLAYGLIITMIYS